MSPIRLMLVDDHDVIRTGLKAYLATQDGLEVIAEASSGSQALEAAQDLEPDVVVMDITMPGMDGLEATRQMVARCPNCKVLALTVHADKQYFFEMLAAGAAGYVTKNAAADELVVAIRAVAEGHVYLQPALATWLLQDYRRLLTQVAHESPWPDSGLNPQDSSALPSSAAQGLETLSEREIQVLEAVAEGRTNSQIGVQLGISPKTVARHRERIMHKLNIHSTTELVKFAIRTGLFRMR